MELLILLGLSLRVCKWATIIYIPHILVLILMVTIELFSFGNVTSGCSSATFLLNRNTLLDVCFMKTSKSAIKEVFFWCN